MNLLFFIIAQIAPPSCAPAWLDLPELDRLVAIETSSRARSVITLELPECEAAPDLFRVSISDDAGNLLARRRASLADLAPRVRLRALALVIAEMIESPVIEPEPAPPPPPPAIAAAPPPPAPPSAEATRTWAVLASARFLPDPGTTTFGLRLDARVRPFDPLPIALFGGAGAELGYDRGPIGDAFLFATTLRAGAGWIFERPGLELALGPALELGWAHIDGHATALGAREDLTDGAIVVAEAAARLELALTDNLHLQLELGLGWALRGLLGTAEDAVLIGFAGPSARLGAGLGSSW